MTLSIINRILAANKGVGLRNRLVRGAIGVGSLKLISLPLSLSLSVLLARALGPEGFGRYSFIISVIAIISLPLDKGMQQFITREVATYYYDEKWNLFKGLIFWSHQRVLLGSLLLTIIFGSLAIYHARWMVDDRWTLMIVSLFLLPFLGLNALRSACLRGLSFVVYAQLPELIIKPGFQLIFVIFLLEIGLLNPATAIFGQAMSVCCAFIIGAFLLRRRKPPQLLTATPEYKNKNWTRAWIPFTLLMAASMFNNQVSILFLGWFGTDVQVAALRVADQGAHLVMLSLAIVNLVIAPHITNAYKLDNKQRIQQLSRKSARVAFWVALPIAIPLIFFGEPIVELIFGVEYIELSVAPLAILTAAQLINVSFGSVGLFLSMSGFERDTLVGQIVALIFNALFAIILIPRMGAEGAAYAAALGLIIWNCILAIKVYQRLKVRPGII